MECGDTDGVSIGTQVIFLSSLTRGKHNMFNNCQDVMAIFERFGYPDLFMTIIHNSNWSEIKSFIYVSWGAIINRPDIAYRVF